MDRLEIQKEVIRLYDIMTRKPVDSRYGGRYNQRRRDAYKMLINIYNQHFGTFDTNKSTCGSCAKNFIKDIKKLINKWQTEKK